MSKKTGDTLYLARQSVNDFNSLDIYIYDDIEGDSVDWFWGDVIESDTSANHIRKILDSNKTATQINVYINSNGGEIKEAVAIASQLKRHQAHTTAYIDAFCCSAACDIALSCDEVIMYKGSVMMLHHASMYCYGNPSELRKIADDLEVMDKASCSTYMRKGIKITQEELNKIIDGEDGTGSWLTAEDCLEKGLCDKIADYEETSIEVAKQKFNDSISQHIKVLSQHKKSDFMQKIGALPAQHKEEKPVDKPQQQEVTEPINQPIGNEEPVGPQQKEEPKQENNFTLLQKMFKKESDK